MYRKNVFSVIVPVYNKYPHLERSINSVLDQSYKEFELIIVDDASTDGSSEKIRTFEDRRVRLFERSDPGPGGYAARNLGIANATHDWILFLDADDEWDLDLLNIINETINEEQGVECVTWGWHSVNKGERKLDKTSKINVGFTSKKFELIDLFNQSHTLWTGAVAFRKDLLVRAGCFPESGFKRGGDVDTWIRCLLKSQGNVWINRQLSFYYIDSVNMVTKSIKRESLYIFSDTIHTLLSTSKNRKLIKAIKSFQNERIYSILRGQIIEKQQVDYTLLSKMNLFPYSLYLSLKLILIKLRYSFDNYKRS